MPYRALCIVSVGRASVVDRHAVMKVDLLRLVSFWEQDTYREIGCAHVGVSCVMLFTP